MNRLVSVIIPCYNAVRWVSEAIQSCLNQTHQSLEVIVIDDGSTDRSPEVIKSFGDKIRWESGSNRGGNHARNRGFALSRGEYIQFLDADDYLMPEKIARQVAFLESSGADVVYGDWQHQYNRPDGAIELGDIVVSGNHDDILEALLGDWWVAPAAVLVRREAVLRTGGWDESLEAAQDRDYMISLAVTGSRILYQPGCYSVYRRPGITSITGSNRKRWLDNQSAVLTKTWRKLEKAGCLTDKYRKAMAHSYFTLAQNYFGVDRDKYAAAMKSVIMLDAKFRPRRSAIYKMTQRMLGFYGAERLAQWRRNWRKSRT